MKLNYVGFVSSALLCVCVVGCGKSTPAPEVTQADLEITNAPSSAAMRQFVARPGSRMRIDGTANMIHPVWRVESSMIGGYLEAGPNFPVEPGQKTTPGKVAAHAQAFVIVRSLKSVEENGKAYSDKMDDVMYEHLKATGDPKARITYYLGELALKGPGTNNNYLFESKGDLVVAGVTNAITMPVIVTPLPDHKLRIDGAVSVKMTDFKVEPPSPKFLPLKTGDEVKLSFEWQLVEKPATNSVPAPR